MESTRQAYEPSGITKPASKNIFLVRRKLNLAVLKTPGLWTQILRHWPYTEITTHKTLFYEILRAWKATDICRSFHHSNELCEARHD